MDDGPPPHLDNATQFSNDLAKYSVQKIETIRRQFDTDQTDSKLRDNTPSAVLVESVPSFPAFKVLSASDVKQRIQKSALRSCPLDPMPSILVSKCEVLLPALTNIINNSLQSGCFPDLWKEALVFLLPRKETWS